MLVMEERMARDPRYDVLFEPVKIGPVTACRSSISVRLEIAGLFPFSISPA
jgi:hypothetical protein